MIIRRKVWLKPKSQAIRQQEAQIERTAPGVLMSAQVTELSSASFGIEILGSAIPDGSVRKTLAEGIMTEHRDMSGLVATAQAD